MLGRIKKALAAAVGVALTVATALAGLWFIGPGQLRDIVTGVIAVLTPLAVYLVPNTHTP